MGDTGKRKRAGKDWKEEQGIRERMGKGDEGQIEKEKKKLQERRTDFSPAARGRINIVAGGE